MLPFSTAGDGGGGGGGGGGVADAHPSPRAVGCGGRGQQRARECARARRAATVTPMGQETTIGVGLLTLLLARLTQRQHAESLAPPTQPTTPSPTPTTTPTPTHKAREGTLLVPARPAPDTGTDDLVELALHLKDQKSNMVGCVWVSVGGKGGEAIGSKPTPIARGVCVVVLTRTGPQGCVGRVIKFLGMIWCLSSKGGQL